MAACHHTSRVRHARTLGLLIAASSVVLSLWSATRADEISKSVKKAPALYKQSMVLTVATPAQGQKLEDFCSDQNGRILALIGPADSNEFEGEPSVIGAAFRLLGGATKKVPKFEPAVHIYDAGGKLISQWAVGFPGQAINTAPDGTVLIGGDGRVARFDVSGKKLLEAEAPQMTYIKNHTDDMRVRAKEQLESDRAMYADQIKEFEDQLKELKAEREKEAKKKAEKQKSADKNGVTAKSQNNKSEVDEGQLARINEQNLKSIVDSYKQQAKQLEKKTIDQALQEVVGRARKIHAISASQNNVLVTCPAMAGYGYGVWRTDTQFENAKEIVKSLSGCCGQMDVQCRNGEVFVCENSRHRVIRFDIDGKEIAEFGKRDREGEGENFGGCCNPMNLCFSKNGNLFVSESNGVVKHFTPDGKYLGIVGIAKVESGCKNSCVAVNADESRLYYIDIYRSQIIVMARANEQARK